MAWCATKTKTMFAICLAAIAPILFDATAYGADLRGHGGPVRAIAVTADGKTAITGSFDAKAIVWSLGTGAARDVLLFHDGEVDAVAVLPQGRFATAGADGRGGLRPGPRVVGVGPGPRAAAPPRLASNLGYPVVASGLAMARG